MNERESELCPMAGLNVWTLLSVAYKINSGIQMKFYFMLFILVQTYIIIRFPNT